MNPLISTKDDPDKFAIQPPGATVYKPPAPTFDNVTGIPSAQSFNDPTASVAYKANTLYQEGSPILDSVRTKTNQIGESRGLLNSRSNMAGAESAVLNAAASLVAPDAAAEQDRLTNTQLQTYSAGNALLGGRIEGAATQQQQGFQSAMTDFEQKFQENLANLGYEQELIRSMGTTFGNLVDSQVAAMGRIIATPEQTWDQTKQNDFENTINTAKEWMAGLYSIPLS